MRKVLKTAKNDFNESSLPKNRTAQFFDIFKIEWRTLFKLGLLTLLFTVPYLVIYFLMMYFAANAESNWIIAIILGYFATYLSYFVMTVNFAGMSNVIKKMIQGEGILFKDDYVEGIKRNYGQFAVITAVYGLFFVVINFSATYIFGYESFLAIVFSGVLKGGLLLLFTPLMFVIVSECATYDIKLKSAFINSFTLVMSRFAQYLCIVVLFLGADLIYLIGDIRIVMIILSCLCILIVPLVTLIISLISTSSFDVFINKETFPELYRKGLKKEGN